jgi:hypothetical protein
MNLAAGPEPVRTLGRAPTPGPAAWCRRVGSEARNVTITTLAGLLVLALLVGAVILITALAVG